MTARGGKVGAIPLVLVRLKLRLLRNRASKGGGALAMALGVVGAVLSGILGFGIAIAGGTSGDLRLSRALIVIGSTVLVLGWAVLPLLAFGTDETLDPARLQLLPLARRPLMTGLLLASLIGYGPFAILLTMLGVVVGYGSGAGTLVTLVAVVLLVLLAAACARALATALAASLTSRRGRDVLIFIGAVVVIGLQFIRFIDFGNVDPEFWDRVSNIARWLPPGTLGQAIFDASNGHSVRAVAELVPALIAVPLLLAAWGRALDRSLTVVSGGSTSPRAAAEVARPTELLPRGIPFLRPTAWGAVAAKELRYVARDPRRKVAFGQLLAVGIGGPIWFAIKAGSLSPASVLIASFAGYLTLVGAMNQFGFDGGALWLDIVAGNHIRDELIGKNFAMLVQVLPIVLVGSFVLALFSGGWIYIPAALLIAVAGLGAGLAVANVVSVRYPQRLPETRSPFGGGAGGQGCVTALMVLLAVAVQGVLLAPVAIATSICIWVAPIALVVVVPACAGYGYLLWRQGIAMAERWAWWRQPELLTAVDQRRGT